MITSTSKSNKKKDKGSKNIKPKTGHSRSLVRSFAYRLGLRLVEKVKDSEGVEVEKTHNFARKKGIISTGVLAPKNSPSWVYDAHNLAYKIVEGEERLNRKKNAPRWVRDVTIALQSELSDKQNEKLLKNFLEVEIVQKLGLVVTYAIHDENKKVKNKHAHVMIAERRAGAEGFIGNKIEELGKKDFLNKLRASWAEHVNQKFAQLGRKERITHKSYKELGIDIKTTKHIGSAGSHLKSKGHITHAEEANIETRYQNLLKFLNTPIVFVQYISAKYTSFSGKEVSDVINKEFMKIEDDGNLERLLESYDKSFQDIREDFVADVLSSSNLETLGEEVQEELEDYDYDFDDQDINDLDGDDVMQESTKNFGDRNKRLAEFFESEDLYAKILSDPDKILPEFGFKYSRPNALINSIPLNLDGTRSSAAGKVYLNFDQGKKLFFIHSVKDNSSINLIDYIKEKNSYNTDQEAIKDIKQVYEGLEINFDLKEFQNDNLKPSSKNLTNQEIVFRDSAEFVMKIFGNGPEELKEYLASRGDVNVKRSIEKIKSLGWLPNMSDYENFLHKMGHHNKEDKPFKRLIPIHKILEPKGFSATEAKNFITESKFENIEKLLSRKGLAKEVEKYKLLWDLYRCGNPWKLIVVIRDADGKVMDFTQRVTWKHWNKANSEMLKEHFNLNVPKYKNRMGFQKSKILVDLYRAKKGDSIVLVEGYLDAINPNAYNVKAGNDNLKFVALGSAGFNDYQAELIASKEPKICYVFMDNDITGMAATKNIVFKLMKQGVNIAVAFDERLAKDPDEYLNKHGAKALGSYIGNSGSISSYFYKYIEKSLEQYIVKDPKGNKIQTKEGEFLYNIKPAHKDDLIKELQTIADNLSAYSSNEYETFSYSIKFLLKNENLKWLYSGVNFDLPVEKTIKETSAVTENTNEYDNDLQDIKDEVNQELETNNNESQNIVQGYIEAEENSYTEEDKIEYIPPSSPKISEEKLGEIKSSLQKTNSSQNTIDSEVLNRMIDEATSSNNGVLTGLDVWEIAKEFKVSQNTRLYNEFIKEILLQSVEVINTDNVKVRVLNQSLKENKVEDIEVEIRKKLANNKIEVVNHLRVLKRDLPLDYESISDKDLTLIMECAVKAKDKLLKDYNGVFTEKDLSNVMREFLDPENEQLQDTIVQYMIKCCGLVKMQRKNINGEQYYSTKHNLDMEIEIFRSVAVLDKLKSDKFINIDKSIKHADQNLLVETSRALNDEQKSALKGVLEDGYFSVIEGDAGTGKTTLMKALKSVCDYNEIDVYGLSFTGKAAMQLQNDSGIISRTTESFTLAYGDGNGNLDIKKNSILVIDEAGMLSTKKMNEVLKIAEEKKLKVIMVGDTKQIQPIASSQMLQTLIADYGKFSLVNIFRQQVEWQREASKLFAKGEFKKALNLYNDNGKIYIGQKKNDSTYNIVLDFVHDVARGDTKIEQSTIIARENQDVDEINEKIKIKLYELGFIKKTETDFYIGEKIMFLENDYKNYDVRNGSLGIVVKASKNSLEVKLLDEDRVVKIGRDYFDKIKTSYAVTGTKYQGGTADKTYIKVSKEDTSHEVYTNGTRHRKDVKFYVDAPDFEFGQGSIIEKVTKSVSRDNIRFAAIDFVIDEEEKLKANQNFEMVVALREIMNSYYELAAKLEESSRSSGEYREIKDQITGLLEDRKILAKGILNNYEGCRKYIQEAGFIKEQIYSYSDDGIKDLDVVRREEELIERFKTTESAEEKALIADSLIRKRVFLDSIYQTLDSKDVQEIFSLSEQLPDFDMKDYASRFAVLERDSFGLNDLINQERLRVSFDDLCNEIKADHEKLEELNKKIAYLEIERIPGELSLIETLRKEVYLLAYENPEANMKIIEEKKHLIEESKASMENIKGAIKKYQKDKLGFESKLGRFINKSDIKALDNIRRSVLTVSKIYQLLSLSNEMTKAQMIKKVKDKTFKILLEIKDKSKDEIKKYQNGLNVFATTISKKLTKIEAFKDNKELKGSYKTKEIVDIVSQYMIAENLFASEDNTTKFALAIPELKMMKYLTLQSPDIAPKETVKELTFEQKLSIVVSSRTDILMKKREETEKKTQDLKKINSLIQDYNNIEKEMKTNQGLLKQAEKNLEECNYEIADKQKDIDRAKALFKNYAEKWGKDNEWLEEVLKDRDIYSLKATMLKIYDKEKYGIFNIIKGSQKESDSMRRGLERKLGIWISGRKDLYLLNDKQTGLITNTSMLKANIETANMRMNYLNDNIVEFEKERNDLMKELPNYVVKDILCPLSIIKEEEEEEEEENYYDKDFGQGIDF